MKTIYLIMGTMAFANAVMAAHKQNLGVGLLNVTLLVFWIIQYRGRK